VFSIIVFFIYDSTPYRGKKDAPSEGGQINRPLLSCLFVPMSTATLQHKTPKFTAFACATLLKETEPVTLGAYNSATLRVTS
jgi:hypothetical protein